MRKRLFFIVAFLLVNLCASILCAQYPNNQSNDQTSSQLPYRSGTNTNYGTSGLNSFMRNSSQSNGLAKYLANDNSTSSGPKYPSFSSPNQTTSSMSPNQSGTSSNAISSLNNRTQMPMSSQSQTSMQGLSSMSSSSSYSQNLKDYNLQPIPQANNNSNDILKRLDELTRHINSLEKKIENGNSNTTTRSQPLTMSNNRPIEVTSSSEMFSGYDNNNSESFLRNSINPNPYQGAIDSSSSRMSQPEYNASNFSNQNQQSPSNDSLDDIRAKLDELSRSIGTHIQTNDNNTQGYGTGNNSLRGQQNNSSFRSYSQSQFDKYYSTAQNQLLRGNYTEAADSFTLASIYEPENANCYAGHGHALFAAGQFVSSALYIIRAIELNPEYIQANIDLVPSIGNRNIVDMRTSELEQLLKKAPASGLQILTAYVYYRTGKLANAKQIINAVYQEMPNSRAAIALKIAIDSKTNYSR